MCERQRYTIKWVRCSTGEVVSCSGLSPLLVFRRIRELLRHESSVTILSLRKEAPHALGRRSFSSEEEG